MANTAARSGIVLVARVIAWIGITLLALAVLAALTLVGLNTTPGRAFVARQISVHILESGLRFEVGRVDGSLFGGFTVHDLRAIDLRGVYATIPRVDVRWRPGAVLQQRLSIDTLEVPQVSVLRLPIMRPTPGPLLPSYDIRLGHFHVGRIVLAPAIAGRLEQLHAAGAADIRAGRALVDLDANALTAGDRLLLHLIAFPDGDRFELAAQLRAPAGGVMDGLTKLGKPLDAAISGQGTYKRWGGTARATLGGKPLAELRLTAAAGSYRVTGDATPNAVLTGSAARLLAPSVDVDATARVVHGGAVVNAKLSSAGLGLTAAGRVGPDARGFVNLVVDVLLPKPELAYAGLAGRNVRARLVLNGPVTTPIVTYAINADTLEFRANGVGGLSVAGRAVVPARGPVPIPFTASARVVNGVPQAAGELVRGLRVEGTLNLTRSQLAGDGIRFRSDRLAGTATAAYTLATGEYAVALNGTVSRYAVAGLGLVDVAVQSHIAPSPKGELTVRANIAASAVRLDNAASLDFLGGLPRADASIERLPSGAFLITGARLRAPRLTLGDGHGSYLPDGRVTFAASGRSAAYGPVILAIDGQAARPRATVRLASPGLGFGLTNVVAVATPSAAGYAIAATGAGPEGPLAARVRIALGQAGPLAVDIDQLSLAGLDARGRVSATAAGPYAGHLAVDGAGLTGALTLDAAGRVQRVAGELSASNARLPLTPPVTIGSGRARFTALLTPDRPAISGRADLANVRRGGVTLTTAVASVDYQGGHGAAGARLAGISGQPFTARLGVAFTPGRYRVALDGTVDRVAFRLARPAEVAAIPGGYRLSPATLLLPSGRLDLSGETGTAATVIDARLSALDLSIAALIDPDLRLGGTASGAVQLRVPAGGPLPSGYAELNIAQLTRIGIIGASVPVDVAAAATLAPAGADANAIIRRQGGIIGRLQARVIPAATGTDTERVLGGALSGGVRFNGPAEALWALSGISGQDVRGALAVGADFGGRPNAPAVNGVARAAALRYENLTYGTVIDRIQFDSRFTGSRFELMQLTGHAGAGTLSASGVASIDPQRGFPFDFRATLKSAQLASSQAVSATVSGDARAASSGGADAKVTGSFTVEKARYRIQRADTAPVATLVVRHKGAPPELPEPKLSGPSRIALAVRVKADGQIFVQGLGLDSEWRANVRAGGTLTTPELGGTADIVRGTYSFSGKNFDITRGRVSLDGSYPPEPAIDIVATATLPDITATITIGGTASRPDIVFASMPALPQDEILSRLLFGSSVTSLSPTEALQLASALNGLRGGGGGLDPIGKLRKVAGIDRLRIIGADKTTGRGTAVAFGKYIGRKVYVEVTTDAQGNAATSLQYTLSRIFSVLAQVGATNQNSVNFRYSRDY